jgi:hypothetical protein
MSEDNVSFQNILNSAGYLFQISVENEISAKLPLLRGEWSISAREHRWFNDIDKTEGFIDLVLTSGNLRMVIECKKTEDSNWLFINSSGGRQTAKSRLLWTIISSEKKYFSNYHDFHMSPSSSETMFCVVRGQDNRDMSMLDRISSNLMKSVESLASEEFEYGNRSDHQAIVYIPAIITNAKILECIVDPSKIDINTGHISESDIKEIPFIRYRKNFYSGNQYHKTKRDMRNTNSENDRTIIVINSNSIINTLKEIIISYRDYNAPWPWENIQ